MMIVLFKLYGLYDRDVKRDFIDNSHFSSEWLVVARRPEHLASFRSERSKTPKTRSPASAGLFLRSGGAAEGALWGAHSCAAYCLRPLVANAAIASSGVWQAIVRGESIRRHVVAIAEQAPGTTVVSVSDSEGDIYECLLEPEQRTGRKADWIIRACQDRAIAGSTVGLWQTLQCRTRLGTLTIRVSKREASTGDGRVRRQPRQARKAKVTVRTARVLLRPPDRKGTRLPALFVNAVLVHEEKPPAGAEPIEWLLLTSLPIETFAEACQVVDYYSCRWEIEIYFRVLKSGCKIEELQLEQEERLQAALALYMIVAWRVLFVLMMGRECPDLPCDAVLGETEWKSVYVIMTDQAAPRKPPTLRTMVELIAELGGYLGRKHDGPPGPQTTWIGMQRMRDFAIAWGTFGPGRPK
jgi:hypothetical protein